MGKKGVIYVATGKEYVEEAVMSAKSLVDKSPKLNTALFTDDRRSDIKPFNKVIGVERSKYPYLKRIESLVDSPFERTLFLDTDTYIAKDISNIFEVLNRFEFAASHAPIREAPKRSGPGGGYLIDGVPDTFPELNGGVLLFKKNEGTIDMIKEWERIYRDALERIGEWRNDQPALRKALYESSVRYTVLPREYNLRLSYPGYIFGSVKIFHGRTSSIEHFSRRCNEDTGPRAYIPGLGVIKNNNIFLKSINKIKNIISK